MVKKPYQPIACALHDEYEIAIMHKNHLDIRWTDNDGSHTARVLPIDIRVKDGEEFLIAVSSANRTYCIRLDRLTLLTP
jgi:transcriptional antiterminator Rof (Rho-off)